MSCAALVLLGNRSSLRIQDEPVNMRSLLDEVEHVVQRARDRIGRAAAGPAEVPILENRLWFVLMRGTRAKEPLPKPPQRPWRW